MARREPKGRAKPHVPKPRAPRPPEPQVNDQNHWQDAAVQAAQRINTSGSLSAMADVTAALSAKMETSADQMREAFGVFSDGGMITTKRGGIQYGAAMTARPVYHCDTEFCRVVTFSLVTQTSAAICPQCSIIATRQA